MITAEQLGLIYPKCPRDQLVLYSADLSEAMDEGDIITVLRASAFLGQVGLESGQLRWWVEFERKDNPNFVKYEQGRLGKRLGNVKPGDGARYKGRGPIQLTGRKNYADAGLATGYDLVSSPEMVEKSPVGFAVAVWYWNSRDLNDVADRIKYEGESAWREITKAINGGYTHHDRRTALYRGALEVLSADMEI